MIYSWVLILVLLNVIVLTGISVAAVYYKPNWLFYSKYQVLVEIQLGIYFSLILAIGALYEAENLPTSRICIKYLDIITDQFPKILCFSVVVLIIHTVYLHEIRDRLLISSETLFIRVIEKIINYNTRLVLISLNLAVPYIGVLFSFVSNLAAFLIPAEIGKELYWVAQFNENSENYWKIVFIVQILLSFKQLVFCVFSVNFI